MSSAVPPVYMKFHPTPSSASAIRKWVTVMPFNATATHEATSAMPARITLSTPKRRISEPVTNPGAYMPTTCHWITSAAAPKGWLQKLIAIGVAVISRFMRP